MSEQIDRIKDYIRFINEDIEDDMTLTFMVAETIDRALIYMNRKELPQQLERVIARAANSLYKRYSLDDTEEKEIKSLTDMAQTISFSDKFKTYMINSSDDNIFYGVTEQLNCYRLAKVVGDDEYSNQHEEGNV